MGDNSGKLLSRDRNAWRSPTKERVSRSVPKVLETPSSHILEIVGKFIEHLFRDQVGAGGAALNISHRRKVMKEI